MPDYLLGYSETEWKRLEDQQRVWGHTLLADLAELGLDGASTVVEVGCGVGSLLADLQRITPHVAGIELDPASARVAAARLGVNVIPGDLFEVAPPELVDFVVARWVLTFIPDAEGAVARMAQWVRPGGHLVIQDYLHDPLRVYPEVSNFTDVVEAFRARFREIGGDLWVAGRLPAALEAAGLDVALVRPHIKAGGPASPVWAWFETFILEHIDGIAVAGHLTADQVAEFRRTWPMMRETPGAVLFSPLQVTVAGNR